MSLPGNGLLVVSGEAALLVTALRRSARWGSHSFPTEEYDVLMRMFRDLQSLLSAVDDLRLLDPTTYLAPFLELVRSKETTGPVTSLALSAINKFLAYGLIDPTHGSVPAAVEDIADAVTHARFVGTDPASDGVVLLKMLQVLRTLMLSPEGAMLTDESVCEIMLSCFRIAFESRLNDLLRRNAEHCLRDMTQLLLMRLPQFAVEGAGVNCNVSATAGLSLRRKERTGKRTRSVRQVTGTNSLERGMSLSSQSDAMKTSNETQEKVDSTSEAGAVVNDISEAEITIELPKENTAASKKHTRHSSMDLASNGNSSITQVIEKCVTQESSDDGDAANGAETTEGGEITNEGADTDNAITNEEQQNLSRPLVSPVAEEVPTEVLPEIPTEVPLEVLLANKEENDKLEEYVNPRGVRFTQQEENVNLQPYGLNCIRELFRFLISLCNPLDQQNTPAMVHLGLSLVGTALEVGADHLAKYQSLLNLVKDPLCRNLLSLLGSDRISIFALDLQVSFLLFESMRHHLKLQMEAFFKKLIDIISTDVTKAAYEMKEITHLALESLAQMFRIPGLCTELYLNYDCDIYCTNLFEDLTKLLSKHAVSSTAYNTHSLSLDALMTIIDAIESTCNQTKMASLQSTKDDESEETPELSYSRGGHVSLELGGMDDASVISDHVTHDISQYLAEVRIGRHVTTSEVPSDSEIENVKKRKRWIAKGTELFNRKPDAGVEYLQQQGVLKEPLDPTEIAHFLRENPALDKKMIGEYICKRSKCGEDGTPSVLAAFADSFDYTGLRIDKSLRLYLETFRLPGEAPLIFLVMEHFAERWHTCNGSPFANTDAAFRLAYAVIMLNMDQHNHNAKKLNIPMKAEDFVKNLRGCNGTGDFEQEMLEQVFNAIKSEEIVMPAEHTGLLKENYLWKVLLRRGALNRYVAASPGALDDRLFDIAWGPTVTALSAAFERAPAPSADDLETSNARDCPALRALAGLEQCAGIVAARKAHSSPSEEPTVDTLVLTMCKFTGLLSIPENATYISICVALGQSTKAQLALRRACAVLARHADCVREAWKHLLDILRTLYVARLLPKSLIEADDFIAESGKVSLIREPTGQRADSGLFSSLYSYIALGESVAYRAPSATEKVYSEVAMECVNKCNLHAILLADSKFLQLDSLQELVNQLIAAGAPPDAESLQLNPQLEDIMVFLLELLAKITVQNRDRVLHIWPAVSGHLSSVLIWGCQRDTTSYAAERALTALLKAAVRLMRSEECAPTILHSLDVLMQLPYRVFYHQADRISRGLYELVKTSAQNVHSASDWRSLLALLAAAGAGAGTWRGDDAFSTPSTGYCSASSRSEGSEDEGGVGCVAAVSSDSELSQSPAQDWILVQNETGSDPMSWDNEPTQLRPHRVSALARCTEALALVVRDVAHVTPYNLRPTVRTVRLLVHASLDGGKESNGKSRERSRRNRHGGRRARSNDEQSDEEDGAHEEYHRISIQLLDLMHTLHSRTAQIFRWWREEAGLPHNHVPGDEEYDLWEVAWMPLLQGIAKLCTDSRKPVANSAVAYLQRALLAPGLQALGAAGWECCFQRVLFPLLEQLMSRPRRRLELTARADTIMCKVFLHHLSALSGRPSFSALWLRVVALQRFLISPQDTNVHVDDALREAALESLKNMILVMDSVKVFSGADGYNELWHVTWVHIGQFLPTLKDELFPHLAGEKITAPPPAPPTASLSLPTLVPPAPATPSPAPGIVRNPLYMPQGPASSVLLQPLSQMVSTPIGITLPTQSHVQPGFPILYPNRQPDAPPASINILEPSRPTSVTIVSRSQEQRTVRPADYESQVRSPVDLPESINPSSCGVDPSVQCQSFIQQSVQSSHEPKIQSILNPVSGPADVLESVSPSSYVYNPSVQGQSFINQSVQSSQFEPNNPIIPPVDPQPIPTQINPYQPQMIDSHPNVAIHMGDDTEQRELYAEYLTNPYNEAKEVSPKELTIYDPSDVEKSSDHTVLDAERIKFPNIDKQKSLSVSCSPMHHQSPKFVSTDNVQRENSGMFNFSSYFGMAGGDIPPGSEILFGDGVIPPQEG